MASYIEKLMHTWVKSACLCKDFNALIRLKITICGLYRQALYRTRSHFRDTILSTADSRTSVKWGIFSYERFIPTRQLTEILVNFFKF